MLPWKPQIFQLLSHSSETGPEVVVQGGLLFMCAMFFLQRILIFFVWLKLTFS